MSAGGTQSPTTSPEMPAGLMPEIVVATLRDVALEGRLYANATKNMSALAEAERKLLYEGTGHSDFRFPDGSQGVDPDILAGIGAAVVDARAAKAQAPQFVTPTEHRDKIMPFLGRMEPEAVLRIFDGKRARFTVRDGVEDLPISIWKQIDGAPRLVRHTDEIVGTLDWPHSATNDPENFRGELSLYIGGIGHIIRNEHRAGVRIINVVSLDQLVDIEFLP